MKQTFKAEQSHIKLTELARAVHVKHNTSKAVDLAEMEIGMTEFQIRWAYCCAGIPNEEIDSLVTSNFESIEGTA